MVFFHLFCLNQQAKISFEETVATFEMIPFYPATFLWFLGRLIIQFPPKVSKMFIFEHFTVFSSRYQSNFTFLKLLKTLIQCSQASWFHCFNTIHSLKSEKSNKGKAETTDKSEVSLIFLTKKLGFLNFVVSTSKLKSVLRKSSPTSKWSIITSNFPVVPRETDWSISSKRV